MKYSCQNCGKEFEIPEYLLVQLREGKLIRINCRCNQKYGLNIVVGVDQEIDDEGQIIYNVWSLDYDHQKHKDEQIIGILQ